MNEVCYMEESAMHQFISACVDEFTSSKKKFDEFVELFNKFGTRYLDYAKNLSKLDLPNLSNSELKERYAQYQQIAVEYSCIGAFVAFVLAGYWFKEADKLVDGIDDKVRAALFRPIKKNSVITLNEKAANTDYKNKEAVTKLWDEYKWLPCLDIHKEPWNLKDVEEIVRSAKQVELTYLPFDKALASAGLEAKRDMFDMIRELAYIRDARDDYRRQAIFYAQELFKEIGKRADVTLKEVAYLTENEIIEFLDSKIIPKSKIAERRKGFLLYSKNSEIICKEGNVDADLKRIGIETEELPVELKGTIGCKGQATGPVKIVRTIHDISKVNNGDILVAVITHPDYVIAMQKAAAIVTDEGGALSHAAIVAREMNIPCVVGTEKATKVLKNGDLISVDADKGIIKKLK
ncbi:MAG: hypothetical protein JSW73_01120 [Candidatus Woesearchaeota archaeon]|nr:MAG: hypothetical protein JSW73_01120 [Candidatus Woesearchaeota archaeon]